jgi:hypothetical protein
VSNVLGTDPLGGVLVGAFGDGNFVSDVLGTSNGQGKGLVPSLAAAISGSGEGEMSGDGLGVTGKGGVIADLTGTDLGGAVLGVHGVIPSGISGGNDGFLGALLADENDNPTLQALAQLLPTSTVAAGLEEMPSLGLTGSGGVSEVVLGNDLVGNIVGSAGTAGGGGSGLVASSLPSTSLPTSALGDALTTGLNIVAGNTTSPLSTVGGALAPASSAVSSGISQTLSGINSIGSTNGGGTATTMNTVTTTVSNTTGNIPILGGLLGGH